MVGSQTTRETSLGSMVRLLRCGILPASRVPGMPLGQITTMTYLLECTCFGGAILYSSSLNKYAVTLYACGTSVEPWLVIDTFLDDRQDDWTKYLRSMDILDVLTCSLYLAILRPRSFLVCLVLQYVLWLSRHHFPASYKGCRYCRYSFNATC